jgi:hypothetical protein
LYQDAEAGPFIEPGLTICGLVAERVPVLQRTNQSPEDEAEQCKLIAGPNAPRHSRQDYRITQAGMTWKFVEGRCGKTVAGNGKALRVRMSHTNPKA